MLLSIPVGISFWNASVTAGHLRAIRSDDVTRIRVWGAGMRTSEENFCHCAMVARPERVYYETSDPALIRDLVSRIRPRAYLDLGPITANCGKVTIDFMKGDQRVFWIHLHGENLRSSKGFLPITSGSQNELEEWLNGKSIRQRIAGDLAAQLR